MRRMGGCRRPCRRCLLWRRGNRAVYRHRLRKLADSLEEREEVEELEDRRRFQTNAGVGKREIQSCETPVAERI